MEPEKTDFQAITERLMSTMSCDDDSKQICEICGEEKQYGSVEVNGWHKGRQHEASCHSCAKKELLSKCIRLFNEGSQTHLSDRGVPRRFLECSFDSFRGDEKSLKIISELKKIDGSFTDSVFLTSERSGTGKTHLAVSIMRNLMSQGFNQVRFISSPYLFLEIKNSFNSEGSETEKAIMNKFCSIPFLIIDDIGVERVTEWALQVWYMIIDRRYAQMMPTVYTSNLSVGDLAAKLDKRIASRIGGGLVYTLDAKDYRIKNN
jgi:DNA replication protein DnaC